MPIRITRDGNVVETVSDGHAAVAWIHEHHSYSVDHALAYEGYAFEQVNEPDDGYADMSQQALTAGLTDAERAAADTLAEQLTTSGVFVKGDERVVVNPDAQLGNDDGTFAQFATVAKATEYLTNLGYRPESTDAAIRKLLADWFEAALFRISEVGHSADWQPLIDDAKARHDAFGIPWSNDFVPQYVREMLALDTGEE